jgi:hypothetical protein
LGDNDRRVHGWFQPDRDLTVGPAAAVDLLRGNGFLDLIGG